MLANTSYKFIWVAFAFLLLMGCTAESRNKFSPTPNAFGNANQLIVVADKQMWEGPVGDTFRFYYSSAYPILPQPEPILELKHFTPSDLRSDPIRKELRNYLLIGNLKDTDSPTTKLITKDIGIENINKAKNDRTFNTKVGRNKWATGQLLMYQFAYNDDDLIEHLKTNFPAITKKVNEADTKLMEQAAYIDGENDKVIKEIKELFDIDIRIPGDYFVAIKEDNTIWLRKENEVLSSNIMIKKLKYTDQAQLSREGIKAIRDSLGAKYISTEIDGTYMRTNDIDLPMFVNTIQIDGKYTVEARGIWDIVNDFMGGPFTSYLIHNPENNELLFIDTFVHAPGKKKRNYMQHLHHIISSVKF